MKNHIIAASAIALAFSATSSANSVSLEDSTFSVFNGSSAVTVGTFDARWGTFSGGVFTPFLGNLYNESNSGYVDVESPEMAIFLTQGDNTLVAAGTQLALAITNVEFSTTSVYAPSAIEAVLTDPSWLAPTFALVGVPDLSVSFTNNTTALKGQYTFNSGNEIINLATSGTVIPEPSSFAAIAGLAVVGLAATRRRRSA